MEIAETLERMACIDLLAQYLVLRRDAATSPETVERMFRALSARANHCWMCRAELRESPLDPNGLANV